jgi:hypothetical protein
MTKFDAQAVRTRITEVARRDRAFSQSADEVAFHMSDWLDDLEAYCRFCAEPGKMSDVEVSRVLTDFLLHVPNHVAAASKLYAGVPVTDIFGVGATSEET